MPSIIYTSSILGLDAHRVAVECSISPGLPKFLVVGLPDAAVQEARERVKSAMVDAQLPFPRTRVVINLAPADLKKSGTGFDLPMAISILAAMGDLPASDPERRLIVGELSLDGRIRPVPGILSSTLLARHEGMGEIIVPLENIREASLVPNMRVLGARHIQDVVDHLAGRRLLEPTARPKKIRASNRRQRDPRYTDMACIRGQETAKRSLEIAAAGGHNLLLEGPPGSGKTLLARTFGSLLPPLSQEEALQVTRIHSVAGLLPKEGLIEARPFRAPHHTASGISLIGGGPVPKPGEVSLAHRGVLFLDEFPEFSRSVLENLRQPLEDGHVTITRTRASAEFPARFLLLAAMNPCPCGYATDREHACVCTPRQIVLYRKRLSGPLLDRIDLAIHVPRVPPEKLIDISPGESSAAIQARVIRARSIQRKRLLPLSILTNAEMTSTHVQNMVALDDDARSLLERAIDTYKLSARSYFRILKVARTIADLAGQEAVLAPQIAEALRYRPSPAVP